MNLFVKIIENGSITATAGQLNIAKSAVSRRLMELENRLGVQLLNRTTRKSSLTEAGRLYYQKAQAILSDTDELTNIVSRRTTELRGILKIAAPLSFGMLHLSPAINRFSEMHPELLFDVRFGSRQIDLVEEGFDLAIRIARMNDSSLIARRFTTIRFTLCASPEYLLKRGIPETPEDLKNHDILKYISAFGFSPHIRDDAHIYRHIGGNVVMQADNIDFLKQAVLAGRGIYYSPTFSCWQEFKEGTLVPLLQDHKYNELGAYTLYPQTRFLSERVRQFIDFLSTWFGNEPYWDNWAR